ncbi:PIG-L deacetylase family protein [Micromonospora sp. ATA51]|uniref:PIG-L deacetylase family protein n=1 Tax=Micromonospora sp. ATA51 TaxID=2806098 RepID=UPI001EE41F69|nr:PIG-L deacetylase family protein [Micromonospora sp. ATA51]
MDELLPALPEDWDRCLAVVAHPDDIEYGAASAIARWTAQGKQVTYLLATRGEAGIDAMDPNQAAPLREEEQRAAGREVGVDVVEFLDHRDGVVEYGPGLRRDIVRAIRRHRPDVIVSGAFTVRMVGGMTNQADHRAVGLATLDAARDAGNRWIFPELVDEGLPPWGGVRYVCFAGAERPTHGVDVTGAPLQRGIASLAAHAEYTSGLGVAGPEPGPFLSWAPARAGRRWAWRRRSCSTCTPSPSRAHHPGFEPCQHSPASLSGDESGHVSGSGQSGHRYGLRPKGASRDRCPRSRDGPSDTGGLALLGRRVAR